MANEPLSQRFTKEFRKGAILFNEGDPGNEMFVVQAGRVDITKRVGGMEKLLATMEQGEFFGEMSILNGKPRSATAVVAEDARLLVIDSKTFDIMLRANTEIALRMVKQLARRLHEADEQIENLLHRDAASRVVHWLIQQAERAGGGPLTIPVSPADLPARVGVEPAAVAEVLDRLEKAKLIERGPQGLGITDAAKLRHFLEFLQMRAQYGVAP
jgi:CRP/FNR family cyclic AMP-dependent transcriptional regulator